MSSRGAYANQRHTSNKATSNRGPISQLLARFGHDKRLALCNQRSLRRLINFGPAAASHQRDKRHCLATASPPFGDEVPLRQALGRLGNGNGGDSWAGPRRVRGLNSILGNRVMRQKSLPTRHSLRTRTHTRQSPPFAGRPSQVARLVV